MNKVSINMKLAATLVLLASFDSYAHASLRGASQKPVEGELRCMLQGINNADKCAVALNDAGDPCSFCTVKSDDDTDQVGVCVDPTVAKTLQETSAAFSCTNIDMGMDIASEEIEKKAEEMTVNDYHDFKCSIKGFSDPEKCGNMRTDDGKHHCKYCTMKGPFGEQGLCVSPAHAKDLKHLSPEIRCSKKELSEEEQIKEEVHVESGVTDCNLSGVDEDTCLDPSKVNGSECVWCDAAIGGFCFPKSWYDKASHFFKCNQREETYTLVASEETHRLVDVSKDMVGTA